MFFSFHEYLLHKLIKLFNMQELGAVIKALNNKTSTEQDGISNRILKHMTFIAKEKVLVLFNKCLSHILKKFESHYVTQDR